MKEFLIINCVFHLYCSNQVEFFFFVFHQLIDHYLLQLNVTIIFSIKCVQVLFPKCKVRVDRIGLKIKWDYFLFPEDCLIGGDPSKYFYVAQGMLTIDGIDDAEEMKATDDAMNILGFTAVCLF